MDIQIPFDINLSEAEEQCRYILRRLRLPVYGLAALLLFTGLVVSWYGWSQERDFEVAVGAGLLGGGGYLVFLFGHRLAARMARRWHKTQASLPGRTIRLTEEGIRVAGPSEDSFERWDLYQSFHEGRSMLFLTKRSTNILGLPKRLFDPKQLDEFLDAVQRLLPPAD